MSHTLYQCTDLRNERAMVVRLIGGDVQKISDIYKVMLDWISYHVEDRPQDLAQLNMMFTKRIHHLSSNVRLSAVSLAYAPRS